MARYYVRRWLGYPSPAVVGLALAGLAAQLAVAGLEPLAPGERAHLQAGRHFELGYADAAPLPAWLLRLVTLGLGDSAFAVRLLPALAGAALVFVVAAMVRRLEGSRFSQALAALAAVVAPGYLAAHHRFGPGALAPLLWALVALVLLDICDMRRRGGWLALGVLCGVSCWITPATALLPAGLLAALLATRQRRWLATPWPWLGLAVTFAIAAPHVWWQSQHAWPAWEQLAAGGPSAAGAFALAQVTAMHPLGLPIWLGGLCFLLGAIISTPYRALAWPFLTVAALLACLGGAPDALLPAYPPLLAAGGLAVDRFFSKRGRPWMRPVALLLLLLGGLATTPLALPVLPEAVAARYRAGYARLLPLPAPAASAASTSPSSASTEGRK